MVRSSVKRLISEVDDDGDDGRRDEGHAEEPDQVLPEPLVLLLLLHLQQGRPLLHQAAFTSGHLAAAEEKGP